VTRQVSITERVLAELTGVRVTVGCCRRAELVGVLRFAGQLHPMGGRMVVLATVGSLATAVRVQRGLHEVYACRADVLGPDSRPIQVNTGTPPRGTTAPVGRHSGGHRLLITTGGAELARRTGLLDSAGRGLRGVPPQLVAGRVCDVAALWRGAFLTQGGLSGPGRRAELTVTCPSMEAAMALVGAARRLGVPARSKEPCGQPQVFVRDLDAITTLLSAMGVREMLTRWYQPPRPAQASPRWRRSGSRTCAAPRPPPSGPAPAYRTPCGFSGTGCPRTWPPPLPCAWRIPRPRWRSWGSATPTRR